MRLEVNGVNLRLVDPPKAGTQWIRKEVKDLGGSLSWMHQPAWALPTGIKIGVYRNPFSWYASLYAHAMEETTARSRMKATAEGEPTFKRMVYKWTHPREVCHGFHGWFLPINFHVQCPVLAREKLLDSGVGLWSWLASYFFGTWETWGEPGRLQLGIQGLMRTEHLAEDFGRLLGREVVRPPFNRSQDPQGLPKNRADWFDDEMRSWVEEQEAWGLAWLEQQPRIHSRL